MMLAPNSEFLRGIATSESEAPRCESNEALAKPSQGEVWSLDPVATGAPFRERSIPVWQAVLGA